MAIDCGCCPLELTRCIEGPELLANGDFEASSGTGGASSIGPGWTSDYLPCGPNIFAGGCGGGTYSFFTTNAGQATGNHANAVPIPVLGTRSMAVNVSANPANAIIEWANIPLVNNRSYRFRCDSAIIIPPYSVALRIDNVIIAPLVTPSQSAWTTTDVTFTWTGTTGNHTVGVHSNSGVLGGNDHTFDNFSLKAFEPVHGFLCDGVLQWYNDQGVLITDTENIGFCQGQPRPDLPALSQSWTAFNDAAGPGDQESVCNLTRQPTSTTDADQPASGCFASSNGFSMTLTWDDFTFVEADYTPFPLTDAGAALFTIVYDGVTMTWPVVGELGIGASNLSNPHPVSGKQVRLTAISGANGQRPRWDNATTVRIGENPVGTTTAAIRYRLEIV